MGNASGRDKVKAHGKTGAGYAPVSMSFRYQAVWSMRSEKSKGCWMPLSIRNSRGPILLDLDRGAGLLQLLLNLFSLSL